MSGAGFRSAEEMAREIVQEIPERCDGLGLKIALEIRDEAGRVFVDVETRGEVEGLRALFARTIKRSHADVAAVERRARADGIVQGLRKARSIVFATASGELKDELNHGIDEAIDDVSRRSQEAPAQPRDLAGRIRALVMTWTGRHVDALAKAAPMSSPPGARDEAAAVGYAADDMLAAFFDATVNGHVPHHRIRNMREAECRWRRQAADELEAIVRECAQESKR